MVRWESVGLGSEENREAMELTVGYTGALQGEGLPLAIGKAIDTDQRGQLQAEDGRIEQLPALWLP
jgi:hypothetical protein